MIYNLEIINNHPKPYNAIKHCQKTFIIKKIWIVIFVSSIKHFNLYSIVIKKFGYVILILHKVYMLLGNFKIFLLIHVPTLFSVTLFACLYRHSKALAPFNAISHLPVLSSRLFLHNITLFIYIYTRDIIIFCAKHNYFFLLFMDFILTETLLNTGI